MSWRSLRCWPSQVESGLVWTRVGAAKHHLTPVGRNQPDLCTCRLKQTPTLTDGLTLHNMTLFGLVNLAASRDKMSINACASNEVPRSPVDANFKAIGASRMRKQQEQEQKQETWWQLYG
ncbi:hypothetical protein ACLKA7_004599 [Drosophila subpalustris]